MSKQLYPLKFVPIYKARLWGGAKIEKLLHRPTAPESCGESWEISAIPQNISVVSNGFLAENDLEELIEVYMGDLVGDTVFDKYGTRFPLLIKFIDASEKLSVQVHPNDEVAQAKADENGKTEMWYIIKADENTQNISGLKHQSSKEKIIQHLANNNIEGILFSETAIADDIFYIPAGRIHATGKGVLMAEIQQNSDLTYRLYDYNRIDSNGKRRELHITDALDAIDYNMTGSAKIPYQSKQNGLVNLIKNPYFTTNRIDFDRKIVRNYAPLDSFVIYICLEGLCTLICEENSTPETLQCGETCLIPAMINEVELIPETENVKILEVYIEINQYDN